MKIAIIVIDTLRLDTFNELKDKKRYLLEDFSTIDSCIAPAPWTLPSHASLFTGLYPSQHKAHETKYIKSLNIDKIKLKKKTFVSILNKKFKTIAISANPYVNPIYGFDEFKIFYEETYFTDVFGSIFEVSKELKEKVAKYRDQTSSNTLLTIMNILKNDKKLFFEVAKDSIINMPSSIKKKFKAYYIDKWPLEKGGKNIVKRVKELNIKDNTFLFVNLMEAHDPYLRRDNFNWSTPFLKIQPNEQMIKEWKNKYRLASERAMIYAKDIAERFLDDGLVIITSDHGQEFNEHGFIGHGTMLHDEIVKVPLAIHMPKRFEFKEMNKYSSLVNISKFLFGILSNNKSAYKLLYSNVVYSESFGIPANISMIKGIDINKIMKNEIYRKRVFKS